jgi:hypothetical protein
MFLGYPQILHGDFAGFGEGRYRPQAAAPIHEKAEFQLLQ